MHSMLGMRVRAFVRSCVQSMEFRFSYFFSLCSLRRLHSFSFCCFESLCVTCVRQIDAICTFRHSENAIIHKKKEKKSNSATSNQKTMEKESTHKAKIICVTFSSFSTLHFARTHAHTHNRSQRSFCSTQKKHSATRKVISKISQFLVVCECTQKKIKYL